jgi:hypothetical protein
MLRAAAALAAIVRRWVAKTLVVAHRRKIIAP